LETLIRLQKRRPTGLQGRGEGGGDVALDVSDAEDTIADWLDSTIFPAMELAPRSSRRGLTCRGSIRSRRCGPATLEGALRWLNYTVETELLMNEIEDSTSRISTLVGAAKQYSQLDRAPYQVVDVHELLDSTLMMLAARSRPESTW